jgi:tripartite-type tricarboxylate transporter receptor subunit TctC
VGFPAGGSTDSVARIVGDYLSERLGQRIVIENKPGAGSNIAAEVVARAPSDGHTLLFLTSSNAIHASVQRKAAFDLLRDIAPVAGLVRAPIVMVVHPAVPATSVAEFIAYAKADPGKLNMCSPGTGTTAHLSGELFKLATGVDLVHVPYRGSAPALTDLIAGQVQVMFDPLVSALPHIQSGALRALGLTTADRSHQAADVPTIAETVPGYEAVLWFGVGVPKSTATPIVERLNREVNAGLSDHKIGMRLSELGATPWVTTSGEFEAFVAAEIAKWDRVVRSSGVKVKAE